MTAEAVKAPKPAKPVLAIALAGCCIVLLMTAASVINGLAGGAAWPAGFKSPAVVVHLGVAALALPLTILQLARRKGTRLHRMVGYVWCALLMGGALVSFFVHEMTGGFSPPHLFAITTVIVVPLIIWSARTRKRKTHRNLVLLIAYTQIVAGALTFIPARHSLGDLFWPLFG